MFPSHATCSKGSGMPDPTPLPSPIPPPNNPDPIPAKPDFLSKTFWLNLLTIAANAALMAVLNNLLGQGTFSLSAPAMDSGVQIGSLSLATILTTLKLAGWTPALLALANLLLRYKTETAINPFWKVLIDGALSAISDKLKQPTPPTPPSAAIVTLFVSLLAGTVAIAAPPKAVVNGPATGIAGELLELDASGSTDATHFRWWVAPVVSGRRQVEPLGDGKRARIASLPGTYTYTVGVSNAEGLDVASWVVSIPGDAPPPAPSPAPPCPNPQPIPPIPGPVPPQPIPVPPTPPTPEPSFPAGQYNVAADVYHWALEVKSASRATECKALAEATEAVAAAAAAGTYNSSLGRLLTAKNVSTALLEANRKALGTGLANWQEFGGKYGERIGDLFNKQGKLNSGNEWAVLLRESAMGLRAASLK